MREILFRGKTCGENKWVEGYYVKAKDHFHKRGIHEDYIITSAQSNSGCLNILGRSAVKPETVGQYTGIKDKNGTKIFEGDIIKRPQFRNRYIIGFSDDICAFTIKVATVDVSLYIIDPSTEYEVIGNIYDNPELLEKKGELI